MPWRQGVVLALGLTMGGCFLPAYQIVSWTATGVSYVFSGKGVSDHAMSLALHQDCAALRALQGEELCIDYESDFEDSWTAMASTWRVPQPEEANIASAAEQSADGPVTNELKPTPVLALISEESAAAPEETTASIFLWANAVDGPSLALSLQAPEKRNRGLDFDGLVKSGQVAVARRDLVRDKEPAEPAIYLVMGSFRDKRNAERLRAGHADFTMAISKVVADGRTLYRLLAGPVEKAAVRGLSGRLAKAGVRNSWAVRLCQGSFAPPPCQSVLQQAALP